MSRATRRMRPGAHEIDIDMRDVDVPLSELGHEQAEAAGPLVRRAARATSGPRSSCPRPMSARARPPRSSATQGALAGGPARTIVDERLREREFGIFDRLTTLGIRERFPEEAAHRAPARQILSPRRRAARAGPTSSCACARCSTPSTCIIATGACWSSATRSSCCASATSSRSSTRRRSSTSTSRPRS